jgi:integrase/recombinase XerD
MLPPKPSRSSATGSRNAKVSPTPLFPTRQGRTLSPDAVELLLAKHANTAASIHPSLKSKRVTPHTLRHTNAMLLRAGGADPATIALWLGHENTNTTSTYEHADPALKEQPIARTAPIAAKPGRYRPDDALLVCCWFNLLAVTVGVGHAYSYCC